MPIPTIRERIGTDIAGRYRTERLIGRGGMGVVYGGRHLWTERPVAIKVLKSQYSEDPYFARRFLQEARTAAGIRHPHVVDVLDMGQDEDGTVYIVLELLAGESLADRLKRTSRLSPDSVVGTLLPVMEAVAKAHARGVVHRDLKPDNIFLAEDEVVSPDVIPKVLDFGIAKVLEGSTLSTHTGAIIGTPAYMAPEQFLGGLVDAKSDQFAFCVSAALPTKFQRK